MAEAVIYTDSMEQTVMLFGSLDANLNVVENAFSVRITAADTDKTAGNAVIISGDDYNVKKAFDALTALKKMLALNGELSEQYVSYVLGTFLLEFGCVRK